ncbi:MAG: UDP-N-acetylmuramate--L-alanine ligase [bacterium]
MDIDFNKIKKAHFIGIGGIGVSAIARLFLSYGKEVSGSDRSSSLVTDMLVKIGGKIYVGHDENNLDDDTDIVIYTIAVDDSNPEFIKAKRLGIKMLSYPETLGIISKEKYTIAVSGTHGKTTTTAMIGKILVDTDTDPTIIVGSLMKGPMSNLVVGQSKYLVVESCEYRRSFLNIFPKIVVITNIDNDHLDYYKDIEDIKSAFEEFVGKLSKEDYLVCNKKDERLSGIVENANCIVVDYSENTNVANLKLKVNGNHNIENAKAALTVAEILEVDPVRAWKALEEFTGTWRRFEYKGDTKTDSMVYDDYAHHPTEIRATLSGARQFFKDKKIVVAFQPHLYSRTKLLLDDFAKSFEDVDVVLVTDIYAARETRDESINSEILVKEINKNNLKEKAIYSGDIENTEKIIREKFADFDVVITMGAGDISSISDALLK